MVEYWGLFLENVLASFCCSFASEALLLVLAIWVYLVLVFLEFKADCCFLAFANTLWYKDWLIGDGVVSPFELPPSCIFKYFSNCSIPPKQLIQFVLMQINLKQHVVAYLLFLWGPTVPWCTWGLPQSHLRRPRTHIHPGICLKLSNLQNKFNCLHRNQELVLW